MVNYFAKKAAGNIVLLFIYAVVLNAFFFTKAQLPLVHFTDGVLYKYCLLLLTKTGNVLLWANCIAFIMLFLQALMVSKLVVVQKLLAQPNYLAGMSFILITAFFANWQIFSSIIFVNYILLIVWRLISELQNSNNPKSLLFNIGLLLCMANFFFSFSFVFLMLVVIALLIYRAFRLNEYVSLLIGYCTPFYLFFVWQFLTNNFNIKNIKIPYNLQIPKIEKAQIVFIAFMLFIGLLMLGFYTVQKNSSKMPIQSRKSWTLMFFWFITSFIIPAFTSDLHYWSLCILPASPFIAAYFYYIKNIKARALLHWVLFGFAAFTIYYLYYYN